MINVLPPEIANMIAAGEVVERPASVVKELAENSVDAGSTSITIEIKRGGMTFIRVCDNGCGIAADEVERAFLRHATSKIKTQTDLNAIYTLGFRGEALASIAAVSRTEVFTKTAESQYGYSVTVEGGEITESDVSGCPNGTTFIVRDLFFNTPARMKFLKSDAAETGYVTDVVNKLVLAHPEIAVKFINNGKTVLQSNGSGKLIDAIYTVFGKDYARNMREVRFADDGIEVSGYIGNASIARKDRRHQIFYINGRNISSKLMSAAVSEAYRTALMTGRFPVVVLNTHLGAGFVDVNVHPTKMEVRFSDDKKIYSAVYWAIKNTLSESKYVPEMTVHTEPQKIMKAPAYDTPLREERKEINMLRDSYIKANVDRTRMPAKSENSPKAQSAEKEDMLRENMVSATVRQPIDNGCDREKIEFAAQPPQTEEPTEAGSLDTKVHETAVADIYEEPESIPERLAHRSGGHSVREETAAETAADVLPETMSESAEKSQISDTQDTETASEPNIENKPEPDDEPITKIADFKVCGQVFNTYIILQMDNDMILMDQHAAHERLYFEQLMDEWRNKRQMPQVLLLPIIMDFSPMDFEVCRENFDFFSSLGFDMDVFGERSVIIRQIPYAEDEDVVRDTVDEIVTLLGDGSVDAGAELFEDALHTMACKRAVKGNKALSMQEMESLAERILSLPDINTCPHGRPITIKMSKYNLEKQFKRIV